MFSVIMVCWHFLRFGCGVLLSPKMKSEFIIKKSYRNKRLGKCLCGFLEYMGPSFVKFGQTLSMRADVMGEEMTQDLARLRDKLKPFSADIAKRTIEEDFGKPILEIFEEFSYQPVSAASIAQVHKAKFRGQDVAVKILRPDIKKRFGKDMKLFRSLSKLAYRFFKKKAQRLNLDKVLSVFSSLIDRETNFLLEAAAADRLRKESADLHQLEIPKVMWDATSERCLTMEWCQGTPLSELSGRNKKFASEILIHTLFYHVLRVGFFHGDLHSGNIFFNLANQKLILVDFGIVSWLSEEMRIFLIKVFRGSIKADYKMVAQAHEEMNMFQEPVCMETFTLACAALISPLTGRPAREIVCSKLLSRLMQTAEAFQITLQSELLILHRTLISAEGVARQLDPNVNVWEISGSVMEGWIRQNHHSYFAVRRDIKTHASKLIKLLNWIEDLPNRR